MVKVEINGQVVEAREGDMLIDVADSAAISIPRFCYHKKLSIAANCRMCLVDVEGAWKAVPACATPVTDGMKVNTKSPKAIAAQKAVMEFLLINHPLDCPICDQGGECELQDVAMDYGDDVSRYSEAKRIVGDRNVGSLIQTDMTRCIHCTRCVRFGQEIAGLKELGATGRSEWMEIGTYIEKSIDSELSGNMIDLCPVGALTNKPFRYKARSWELSAHPTIAPHDSIGSNLFVHTRNGEVMRVVPRENEAVNETWISDRDRFSCDALNAEDRLKQPSVKLEGNWQSMDWTLALEKTIEKLKPYLDNPDDIAILLSPNSTLEEIYLLRKLASALNITNIEHRLYQKDFSADAFGINQKLDMCLSEVEDLNTVLIVGAHLRKDIPLLNHRIRKAQLSGCEVNIINPEGLDYNVCISHKVDTEHLAAELAGVLKAAYEIAKKDEQAWLNSVETNDQHRVIARSLIEGDKSSIMLGLIAQADDNYALLQQLGVQLAKVTGSSFSDLPGFSNTVGANLLLDRKSSDLTSWLSEGRKVFINIGIEPEADCLLSNQALDAMYKAELVINFTAFDSALQRNYADVMLPMALFAENAGTLVNIHQEWQSFKLLANAKGEAKPLWKVLRVLGNMLDLEGFDYVNTPEILAEIKSLNLQVSRNDFGSDEVDLTKLVKSVPKLIGCYSIDPLVRRSISLQATPDARISNQSN
ncbi:NADH-quinone oxidoreductase subunit G [Thiomicrospira microaerophila]|uniref:NADH-quinone oxidoreductase subunit NuoG n=1 Tax=Thiomicrospira microaerophila TaxID=406020 RepID=UPI00200E28FD|nr:NADH-quinone oxidoreductase subunit NuoG [Thiomicrospira microaerophila]UQB42868.1 NADH-quinone oxidoreductase subunit G [Thiomicrospira microaerophila]